MGKILTIIVTYNGEKWVRKTLLNVLNNSSNTDILVIDNASTDQTLCLVKGILNYKIASNRLMLVSLDQNLGFGLANNIGLWWAINEGYDYVFLLNQDAWIHRGSLEDLVEVLTKNPDYGLVSPIHLNGDASGLDFLFRSYISETSLLSDLLLNKKKDLYKVSFVNAAAWLIKSDCVARIGGFDPIFPHYGEDNDYIYRLHYFGYHTGISPNVYICHDRPQKFPQKTFYRTFIFYLNELKRIDHSFKYASFFVFKKIFDQLTSSIMLRDFNEAYIYIKTFYKLLTMLISVYRSRKISKKGGNIFFLQEDILQRLYHLKEKPVVSLKGIKNDLCCNSLL